MLILNQTNKSLFLVLSLLISSLQVAQSAALLGGAAPLPQRAEELPLPNLPGRLVISGLFGGFAGMTAWHALTTQSGFRVVSVATTAAQRFFSPTDPLNACLGGSVVVGAGVGVVTFMKLRSLAKAAERNKKKHNALAVQVEQQGPRLNQMETNLRLLQLQQATSREAQRLHDQRLEAVATDVGNLRTDMRNGFARVAAQAAENQEQTRNQFTQADQARAADTQSLFDQAGAHHAATETRFTTLDEVQKQQLEEQRETRKLLDRLLALAGQQRQRALTQDGAAAEVQPRAIQPGVYLRVQQRPTGFGAILFPEAGDSDESLQ